jgi:hypothetical protein
MPQTLFDWLVGWHQSVERDERPEAHCALAATLGSISPVSNIAVNISREHHCRQIISNIMDLSCDQNQMHRTNCVAYGAAGRQRTA